MNCPWGVSNDSLFPKKMDDSIYIYMHIRIYGHSCSTCMFLDQGLPSTWGMEYTEDPEKMKTWAPLMMEGRDDKERFLTQRAENKKGRESSLAAKLNHGKSNPFREYDNTKILEYQHGIGPCPIGTWSSHWTLRIGYQWPSLDGFKDVYEFPQTIGEDRWPYFWGFIFFERGNPY